LPHFHSDLFGLPAMVAPHEVEDKGDAGNTNGGGTKG